MELKQFSFSNLTGFARYQDENREDSTDGALALLPWLLMTSLFPSRIEIEQESKIFCQTIRPSRYHIMLNLQKI